MDDNRKTHRRDFLRGKAAVAALADVLDQAIGQPAEILADPRGASYLVTLRRRAMACEFEVFLNSGQYAEGSRVALAALDLIEQLEDQMTVFREHSEICQINREAFEREVEVEPRLFALLEQAVELHRQTGGAFDITAGPISKLWGFTRRAAAVPDEADLAETLDLIGSQHVRLDAERSTIKFLKAGIELNLGSIGKGYALDRCAELFAEAGVNDFVLHGGSSSVLARGSRGDCEAGRGWPIGMRNPLRPDRHLGKIWLRGRALATSGSGTQFFIHKGRRFGHLLDPRSGWPAEGVLSATAIAPTAAQADALSTAFYVSGPAGTEEFCRAHPDVGAVLVCPGAGSSRVEVHAIGLGDDELILAEADSSD